MDKTVVVVVEDRGQAPALRQGHAAHQQVEGARREQRLWHRVNRCPSWNAAPVRHQALRVVGDPRKGQVTTGGLAQESPRRLRSGAWFRQAPFCRRRTGRHLEIDVIQQESRLRVATTPVPGRSCASACSVAPVGAYASIGDSSWPRSKALFRRGCEEGRRGQGRGRPGTPRSAAVPTVRTSGFDENAAVIIKDGGDPRGTRIFGPVAGSCGQAVS